MHAPHFNLARQIELSPAAYRRLVDRVADRLEAHLAELEQQPASYENAPFPKSDARMPDAPVPLDELLDTLFQRVLPSGYNTTSPGFFGYFGGGGLPQSAVADLIAGTLNRFVGRWSAAPAAVQIEADVVRWLCGMAGYGEAAGGVLTSGGSTSNLTALFTARQERITLDELPRARMYVSHEAHFSLQKAAMICGLPPEGVVRVRCDARGRMDLAALAQHVREDRERGLAPFLVVATGGTFGAGAVDDIDALATFASRERLWLHLDAAYGGFFMLTQQGAKLLDAAPGCDSITLDPHKSLFLPYGTGALLVRKGEALRRAHTIQADFYGPMQDDLDCIDFCSQAMEQTRAWRGLRLWLPLKLHGVGAFRDNLEEKLALARHAAEVLRAMPGVEMVAEPMLSVLAFRLVREGLDADALQRLNAELVDRINEDQTIFLMATRVNGVYALRMCLLSFRTHADRIDRGLAVIRRAVNELNSSAPQLFSPAL